MLEVCFPFETTSILHYVRSFATLLQLIQNQLRISAAQPTLAACILKSSQVAGRGGYFVGERVSGWTLNLSTWLGSDGELQFEATCLMWYFYPPARTLPVLLSYSMRPYRIPSSQYTVFSGSVAEPHKRFLRNQIYVRSIPVTRFVAGIVDHPIQIRQLSLHRRDACLAKEVRSVALLRIRSCCAESREIQ